MYSQSTWFSAGFWWSIFRSANVFFPVSYPSASSLFPQQTRPGHEVTCTQWRTQKFCSWGGSTNSVEDRENGEGFGGGSPLVRGSGGSCNLVQKISFHIVKFS